MQSHLRNQSYEKNQLILKGCSISKFGQSATQGGDQLRSPDTNTLDDSASGIL